MFCKKIISVTFFICVFTPQLFSQDANEMFDGFAGVWEGNYWVNDFKNNETMTNKWIHNGKFFEMEISGINTENPDLRYSSTSFFTLDDNDNIVGWFFDENGYRSVAAYKGKAIDGKIILDGKSKDYKVKLTFEIKNGKLVTKREYKYSGRDPIVYDVVFTKK